MVRNVAKDGQCGVHMSLFWLLFVRFIPIWTCFHLKGSESGWAIVYHTTDLQTQHKNYTDEIKLLLLSMGFY